MMNPGVKLFKEYLDDKGLKYQIQTDEAIRVGFKGENAPTISAVFIFDDDAKSAAIRAFSICKIPADKLSGAYELCSRLNDKFRWIKFYIDKDNEVTAAADAVLDSKTLGAECYELMMRTMSIIDDAYPVIMQYLWS